MTNDPTSPLTSETAPPATPGDKLVAIVIVLVGTLALVALIIIGVLAYGEKPIPDVLQNIGVSSVTGLVALLAGRTQR